MNKNNFKPKDYLEGKITEEKCSHSILIINESFRGMHVKTYKCLICGETVEVSRLTYLEAENTFIIVNYDEYFSKHREELYIEMIKYISKIYIDEESVDIVALFKNIEPYMQEIHYVLNKPLNKK